MRIRIELADANDPYAIRTVDFGGDGESLLVGRHSEDGTHRLATIRLSPIEWSEVYDHLLPRPATRARYSNNGRQIAFVDERGRAHVFDTRGSGGAVPLDVAGTVEQISSAGDTPLIALSGDHGEIWDTVALRRLWAAEELHAPSPSASLALNRTGTRLAVAARDLPGNVAIVALPENRVTRTIVSPLDGIEQLAVDDRWVAAIGMNGHGCCVWSLASGQRAGEVFCNPGQDNNTAQALHPTADYVAYGTMVGYLVLVDLAANEAVYMENLHPSRIRDLAFSADGHLLATAGDDGTITVLDLDEMLTVGMSTMAT
jgi:WD40 repeat protein